MADIFPLWLLWKRDHTPTAARTLQIHQQKWHKYLEDTSISKIPLRKLTPKDFTRLFREWTKNRSLTSKEFNNVKSIINGIFSYAINKLEIVPKNPIREIDMRQFPLKPVNSKKEKAFNSKYLPDAEVLLAELSYELIPAVDHAEKLIRDAKDQPILNAAIIYDVDIILTGDKDFLSLEIEHPECMTVAEFLEKEGV